MTTEQTMSIFVRSLRLEQRLKRHQQAALARHAARCHRDGRLETHYYLCKGETRGEHIRLRDHYTGLRDRIITRVLEGR